MFLKNLTKVFYFCVLLFGKLVNSMPIFILKIFNKLFLPYDTSPSKNILFIFIRFTETSRA